jgi:endonuclease-8
MPEGPSLILLREQTERFVGRRVLRVGGNSTRDIDRMRGRTVRAIRTWGKHFLIQFDGFALRIHLLLFGSHRVNERKANAAERLSLGFRRGEELNFYACSVRFLEGELDAHYDWSADVMADAWDAKSARRRLRALPPETLVADALLDQDLFAGVGNIIKNEVLHRIRVHPESTVGALPPRKLGELVTQARAYSFDFLQWKREGVLRQHWQVHAKSICPRDGNLLGYRKKLGRTQRRAFYCDLCQRLYR